MRFARPPWPGGGHGNTHQVLGTGSYDQDWKGDTLDVQIGTLYGQTSPFANVALGVQSNVGNQGLIGRKSGQAFPSEDSPAAAYKRLFSGASAGSSGGTDPNAQVKSVLELNQQALSSLKTKLGSLEKERLDAHAAALSRISSRLSSSEQPSGLAVRSITTPADTQPTAVPPTHFAARPNYRRKFWCKPWRVA